MENLTRLGLGNNSLVGTLPSEWAHLGRLTKLHIYSNSLTGTLPAQWKGMENLTGLDLYNNSLVGTLPGEWGQLGSLTDLDISSNSLTGTLPSGWGQLRDLEMYSNFLNGSLPAHWRGVENLTTLFLDKNKLSGTVPWREWASLTNLTYLFASSNRLTGSLPSDVRFPERTILSDNQLSGSLPSNMSGARMLDLSKNSLSGTLPGRLTAPHLEVLYIGRNPLEKPVPDCWLYHRACLPSLKVLSDGGLLRESASSYSWRRRNCRDELAFEWGDLRNITQGFAKALDDMNLNQHSRFRKIPPDTQQADIKILCSNQNVPQVLGGLWGCFVALVLAGYALRDVVIPRWRAFLNSSWAPGHRAFTNIA
eukprot:jgi/Botrbrau1/20867/Bobra.0135s0002.1